MTDPKHVSANRVWMLFDLLDRELAGEYAPLSTDDVIARVTGLRLLAYSGAPHAVDQHSSTCARLYADGWKYGPEESAKDKTSPWLRPWIDLTDDQRAAARRRQAIARTARAVIEEMEL